MSASTKVPKYDDYLEWIVTTPPPDEDVRFFNAIPWTAQHLKDPQFQAVPTPTLLTRPGERNNAFIARTIRTPGGLGHWLMLMRKDLITSRASSLPGVGGAAPTPMASQKLAARDTRNTDFIVLLQIGPDLDGFGGRTHGGALCTILDEVLSMCVEVHRQAATQSRAELYTAQLNVSYRRAVASPGIVAVKTWLEAHGPRKWWLRGQICDENDNVLTEGEGLWLAAKESSL